MTDHDMTVIARKTRHVSGLPVSAAAAGGNPGPSTAAGVFLGIRAAIRHKLGRDSFNGVHVAIQGGRNPSYREEDGQRVMKQSEITVRVVLGRGDAHDTVWTCDFSHDYVTINADYRS